MQRSRCSPAPSWRQSPPNTECLACSVRSRFASATVLLRSAFALRVLAGLAQPQGASRVAQSSTRAPLVGRSSVGASAWVCACPFGGWLLRQVAGWLFERGRASAGKGRSAQFHCCSSRQSFSVRRSSQRLHGTSLTLHQVLLPNPSLKRDCHRQGSWPARRSLSSSASRAKCLPGVSPSAQTLGVIPTVMLARIGLFIAAVCPAILLLAGTLWLFMPNCQAGSIGPASGCTLLGLNLNWLMNLFVLAFMGAFLLVPIGLVLYALAKPSGRSRT